MSAFVQKETAGEERKKYAAANKAAAFQEDDVAKSSFVVATTTRMNKSEEEEEDLVTLLVSSGHSPLVLTHIFSLLSLDDLKCCQLVSYPWCRLVDQLWEHHELGRGARGAWAQGTPLGATEFQCQRTRAVCTVSCLSLDERSIVLALGGTGNIETWDRRTLKMMWDAPKAHEEGVYSVDLNGSLVASGGDDGTVKLWDRWEGDLMRTLRHHDYIVWNVKLWMDRLVSCSYDCTVAYHVLDGNNLGASLVKKVRGPLQWADALSTDLRGRYMSTHNEETFVVEVWDLSGAVKSTEGQMTSHDLSGALKITEGQQMTCHDLSGAVKITEGHLDLVTEDHPNLVTEDHPDLVTEGQLVTGVVNAPVDPDKLFELTSPSVRLSGHTDEVNSVRFQPPYVASGGVDRTVRLWELATGNCLCLLTGMEGKVWSVDLDRWRVVAGGRYGQVVVWSMVRAMEEIEREEGVLMEVEGISLRVGHSRESSVGQVKVERGLVVSADGMGRVVLADFWRRSDVKNTSK